MFANALNHPSTPVSHERMAIPTNDPLSDELPILLRQSLVMWEQVFVRQERKQHRHAAVDAVEQIAGASSLI